MKKQEKLGELKHTEKLWKFPLGYTGSFIFAAVLVLLGFILELFNSNKLIHLPQNPYNIVILIFISLTLLAAHYLLRTNSFIKWLSSIPCSISALVTFAILALMLGFIKQENPNSTQWMQLLGLNHLKNSWPFIFVEIYLLISLGFVVLGKLIPFHRKNIGFLLNHAGLWLTLTAAALGSGDLQRLTLQLIENGKFINTSYTKGHQILVLPFSLKLLDFNMQMYNPGIAIIDTLNAEPIKEHGAIIPLIEKGKEYKIQDWKINVIEMIPSAFLTDSGYRVTNNPISSSVAFITAINIKTSDSSKGWLCSGSMFEAPKNLQIEGSHVFCILKPEPRKYESIIIIKDRKERMDTVLIEVNKPYKTRGWSFYQLSYDEKMGPASKLSTIEAVYDPWLPVVYIGILLMIFGSVYIFWQGRGVKTEKQN